MDGEPEVQDRGQVLNCGIHCGGLMKQRLKYRKLAKEALCSVALLGAMFPLVACKKAEEKVKQGAAYVVGMEEYVYGFPLVIMDATRQVVTAVPKAGEYYAPLNQLLKMRFYVDPDYKVVVRISRNSLWSAALWTLAQSRCSSPFRTARTFPWRCDG